MQRTVEFVTTVLSVLIYIGVKIQYLYLIVVSKVGKANFRAL